MVLFRVTEAGDELIGQLLGADRTSGIRVNGRVARSLLDRLVLAGAAHPLPSASANAPNAADVTAVVPVRDRERGLDVLLRSLAADVGSAVRVVVVDDGSADPDSIEAVVAAHGAELVRHDDPIGPAAARNTGLSRVGTPLVAFIDSDVSVRSRWLDPLLAQLGDGRVAVVAPRVASAAGTGYLARYEQQHSPLDLGVDPAMVRPRSRVSYVPAAALLARTEVVRSLGGFEESMRHGEDVDLIWRMVSNGHLVRYEPTSVVDHSPRTRVREWIAQRVAYGSSAVALESRHPGSAAPVVCSGWSAAAWGLAAIGHPVLGAGTGAATAVALTRKLEGVPALNSASLAASGHLAAGRQLARAVVRPWWPAALGAALVSRRLRTAVVVAVVADVAMRPGGPGERLLALLDDAAYGAGLWSAALRARQLRALAPAFGHWP